MSIAELIVPTLHHSRAAGRIRRRHPRPDRAGSTSWTAWRTTASITVTDPDALPAAHRLVQRQFAAVEKAAAGFRPDAELHRLYRAGGDPITVSPLLAELISAALAAAERTDGDIDPTVAAAMTAVHGAPVGRDRSGVPVCGTPAASTRPVVGWEQVRLTGRQLRVPAGTTLDLNATATAVACDRAAAMVRERLGVGVLVTLGGDAAGAGPAPDGGWAVVVPDRLGGRPTEVRLPAGGALSTSHVFGPEAPSGHLIDPRTGRAPRPVWRTATTIGFSSLEAATYSAATLVRGAPARAWLTQLWVPARLVTVHDDVVTVGPWSAHQPVDDRSGTTPAPAEPAPQRHLSPVPPQRPTHPRRTPR